MSSASSKSICRTDGFSGQARFRSRSFRSPVAATTSNPTAPRDAATAAFVDTVSYSAFASPNGSGARPLVGVPSNTSTTRPVTSIAA